MVGDAGKFKTYFLKHISGELPRMAALNLESIGELGKHAYPVLAEDGSLLGVISHHELLEHASAGVMEPVVNFLPSHRLVTLNPETSIRVAANVFFVEDVLQAPVVSKTDEKKVLGIITLHDVIRQQTAAAAE
jgi:CIC family chloride channel protein